MGKKQPGVVSTKPVIIEPIFLWYSFSCFCVTSVTSGDVTMLAVDNLGRPVLARGGEGALPLRRGWLTGCAPRRPPATS